MSGQSPEEPLSDADVIRLAKALVKQVAREDYEAELARLRGEPHPVAVKSRSSALPAPDVLDMRQVAAKLGKSHSWLKGYLKDNPCGRMVGAKRVFTPSDFAALLNSFPRDEPCPVPSRLSRRTPATRRGGYAAQSAASAFKELRASLSEPKRRKPRQPNADEETM